MSDILKKLREEHNLSQNDLAVKLGITRQTLSKYENGENIFSTDIIKKLSEIFNVDYACFIDNKIPDRYEYNIIPSEKKLDKCDLRIDIPQENIDKFKQVLLYILNKVGAKPNVGQTVIYKLLYFIDFNYYELFEEQLMGLKYIKNTYGPTPIDFSKIVTQMEQDGQIEKIKSQYFNKEQTKYLPRVQPNLSLLSAMELTHINKVLDKFSDMTAAELSDFSHKDIPWIVAKNKEILEYEAVFYRTRETSVREYHEEDD